MSPEIGRNAGQIKTDIKVRVAPRSSVNQIGGLENGVFKVKLTAPPVEGKANKALVNFLSKKLAIPKKRVEILSGQHSRQKSVRIQGLSPEVIEELLRQDHS